MLRALLWVQIRRAGMQPSAHEYHRMMAAVGRAGHLSSAVQARPYSLTRLRVPPAMACSVEDVGYTARAVLASTGVRVLKSPTTSEFEYRDESAARLHARQ